MAPSRKRCANERMLTDRYHSHTTLALYGPNLTCSRTRPATYSYGVLKKPQRDYVANETQVYPCDKLHGTTWALPWMLVSSQQSISQIKFRKNMGNQHAVLSACMRQAMDRYSPNSYTKFLCICVRASIHTVRRNEPKLNACSCVLLAFAWNCSRTKPHACAALVRWPSTLTRSLNRAPACLHLFARVILAFLNIDFALSQPTHAT